MIKLLIVILGTGYIGLLRSECSYEYRHIFCTDLEKSENHGLLLKTKEQTDDVDATAAYLRNVSGKINNETMALFPKIQSLDIQFSTIDEFSPKSIVLNTLYIMNNLKFPNLTKELLRNCCTHFIILFVFNNTGLVIEEGALKYIENLTQLTISEQNITHLNSGLLQGLKKITYLNLKQNGIKTIDEDAFKDLLELNYLDLGRNRFKTIEINMFDKMKVLETLQLSGLEVEEFNPNIFNKQKELKELGLPTSLIKKKLDLGIVIKTFPKLETIGFPNEDKEDKDIIKFIDKCKATGFYITYI